MDHPTDHDPIWYSGAARAVDNGIEILTRVCRVCGYVDHLDPPALLEPTDYSDPRPVIDEVE